MAEKKEQSPGPPEAPGAACGEVVRMRAPATSQDLAVQVRNASGQIVHVERLKPRQTSELRIKRGQAIEVQYLDDEHLAGLQAAIHANKA